MVVKKDFPDWPALALTYIIRIAFWAPTIWIVVVCIERNYSLLMLHVLFSTLGSCLLLVEATLVVTGDALLVAKVSRSGRITLHWVLHVLGLVMLAFGLGMIEYHKIRSGANHFTSDHGKVGLTGYILGFVVAFLAIPTVCTKLLPRAVSVAGFKYFHIFAGAVALIMLWTAQITGLHTNWWQGSNDGTVLTVAAYGVGGLLLLAKPCSTTLSRTFERP